MGLHQIHQKFRQNRDRFIDKATKKARDESGQSIILISVVILSFLMFFQFAVSTGLLINAKISVQSAADAAAYAGAAVQARQLNAIALLNYDMREQYKKFIFRYVYAGSMGNANFPQPLTPGAKEYDFQKLQSNPGGGGSSPIALKVPSICIPFTTTGTGNTNCQTVSLPNTTAQLPSASSLNLILDTLIQQLNAISALQNQICQAQGDINFFVALSWLFRADIGSQSLLSLLTQIGNQSAAAQADVQGLLNQIQPLLGGLGLYPRNIINLMRIQTVAGFINQPAESDITQDDMTTWSKANDAESMERSIQAFQSALANLNTSVFDSSQTSMDELQPASMLNITPVLINFNTYVQHSSQPSANQTAGTGTSVCVSDVDPFPIIGAPVGVTASFTPNVTYAVHLKAFVKTHGILYLPNTQELELDAYAGAKPFGSRIGPASVLPTDLTQNIPPGLVNGKIINDCSGPAKCNVPIVPVGGGFDSYSVNYIQALTRMAKVGNAYTMNGISMAQTHSIAPLPEEVGHFSILPPSLTPQASNLAAAMFYEFIPYVSTLNPDGSGIYRFYAPIYPNSGGDPMTIINGYLDKIFDKTQVGNSSNPFNYNSNQMRLSLQTQIMGYINGPLANANSATAENGETLTFAALNLPMPTSLQPSQGNFWLTQANQVLSSWGPTTVRESTSDNYGFKPRFGYSVKFVTMQDLLNQGVSSDSDDLSSVPH